MKGKIIKCKHCGDEFRSYNGHAACGRCNNKTVLLPRYAAARDELRRLTGLPPMGKENVEADNGTEEM